MTLRAIPNVDRTAILLRKGGWRGEWPADRLDDLVNLYRHLATRDKGRYAAFYASDLTVIEALAKRLRG